MELKSSTGKPIQVALLSSHTIVVPPEGCEVPKMFQAEAFRCGCVPIDVEIEDNEQGETTLTGDDKIAAIVVIMKQMLTDGCKLTGAGLPNLKELCSIAGYHVTKLEAAEAWNVLEAETKE